MEDREAAVDLLGRLAKREFRKADQINCRVEKNSERALQLYPSCRCRRDFMRFWRASGVKIRPKPFRWRRGKQSGTVRADDSLMGTKWERLSICWMFSVAEHIDCAARISLHNL